MAKRKGTSWKEQQRREQAAADQGSVAAKLDTVPPNDLEAERSVLGSVLLVNDVVDEVASVLTPEMFYAHSHQLMFDAIMDMHNAGDKADVVTLAAELSKRDELEEVGGPAYLLQVLETVPHAAHAAYYAKIVRSMWRKRTLIDACTETLREAFGGMDGDEAWEAAEQRLFRAADAQVQAGEGETIGTILEHAFAALWERQETHEVPGVKTGFEGLDDLLSAMRNGSLLVLAARPSMGKTALLCNFVLNVARRGAGALVFSLEQSKLELTERLLCMQGRINSHSLSTGHLSPAELDSLNRAASELKDMDKCIFIDDRGSMTPSQIAATVRRQMRRMGNVKLVVIDYLQLIQMEGGHEFRERAIADVCRRLKFLAKDANIPILALAQLNRGVENREDKRPRLSDLRESGAIEQDADVVMFVHRPDAYDPGDRPGACDVIIAKHRNGPIGTGHLQWIREQMRFEDAVRHVQPGLPMPQDF